MNEKSETSAIFEGNTSVQSIMTHAFARCECVTSSAKHQATVCCAINGKARPSPVEHRRSPDLEADQHMLQLLVPAQVLWQLVR